MTTSAKSNRLLIAVMAVIIVIGPVSVLIYRHRHSIASSPTSTPTIAVATSSAKQGDASPGDAPPAVAGFVGEWHAHGSALIIAQDLSATTTWNNGPCEPATLGQGPLCRGTAHLTLRAEGAALTGRIESVEFRDEDGAVHSEQSSDIAVGQTVRLTVEAPGVLKVAYDPSIPGGNPYMCAAKADEHWHDVCNA